MMVPNGNKSYHITLTSRKTNLTSSATKIIAGVTFNFILSISATLDLGGAHNAPTLSIAQAT